MSSVYQDTDGTSKKPKKPTRQKHWFVYHHTSVHTHKTTEEISAKVPICSRLKASNNEDDSEQYSHPSETMSEEILSARKGVML